MFERLKMLYNEGKVTKAMLKVAVMKKWITQEQKTAITEEKIAE